MDTHHTDYDVVVVGCGLSGLVAGLHLQQEGRRVLILERRSVPGGLCGTKVIDGYEFVMACNDFGNGMVQMMKTLDVPIQFHHPKTRFYFEDDCVIQLPPDFRTLMTLLSHTPSLVRLLKGVRALGKNGHTYDYLGSFIDNHITNERFVNLAHFLCYPLALPPDKTPLDMLQSSLSKEYNYGYDKTATPVGGPQALTDQLVSTFKERGGVVLLKTTCLGVDSENGRKIVTTDKGNYTANFVISSQDRWESYPERLKSGLKIGAFLVAVKKSFPYPKGFHTLAYFPPHISTWLTQLDRGELPEKFGFHIFSSDLPEKPDHYTLNIFWVFPRDMEEPTPQQAKAMESYIFNRTEKMLPGLGEAILYKRFVPPHLFTTLYDGLTSHVSPREVDAGFNKPAIYDPEQDIYFIGNSVYPPGEHAGGAILSGAMAAAQVKDKIANTS